MDVAEDSEVEALCEEKCGSSWNSAGLYSCIAWFLPWTLSRPLYQSCCDCCVLHDKTGHAGTW